MVRAIGVRLGLPAGFADQGPYELARASAARTMATDLGRLHPREPLADLAGAATRYADAYAVAGEAAAASDQRGWTAGVDRYQQEGSVMLDAAVAADLRACARRPSDEQAGAVRTVVDRVLQGQSAERSCAEDVTPSFRRNHLGGARRCARALRRFGRDLTIQYYRTVGVGGVTGVDGVLATANVALVTGNDRRRALYDLTWDDGRWRIDSVFAPDDQPSADEGSASA